LPFFFNNKVLQRVLFAAENEGCGLSGVGDSGEMQLLADYVRQFL